MEIPAGETEKGCGPAETGECGLLTFAATGNVNSWFLCEVYA